MGSIRMSKLDREINAVLDDCFKGAQDTLPKIIAIMLDEDLDQKDIEKKVLEFMEVAKPKTYDDYVNDLKLVFKQNGWAEPK